MTTTGLDVFDRAVQNANLWLKQLSGELGWEDRHDTYMALRAVLHALRDRLTPEEAADLAAQLPLLHKGVFYDGWRPGAAPVKRDRAEFLEVVEETLRAGMPDPDAEHATRCVFSLLSSRVSRGEIEDILTMLPRDLRELWPEPAGR